MSLPRCIVQLALVGLILASCAAPPDAPFRPSQTALPRETVAETPVSDPPSLVETPLTSDAEHLVDLARHHAADLLGVDVSAVALISINGRDWPDAALGCPQPGLAYAQVITPGFQIQLEADEHRLVYHADTRDQVVLCQAKPPHEIYGAP
jgi:hypothetical protein